MKEAEVLSGCLIELSRLGCRVFRNNTGMSYNKTGRPIRYGLCVGSADIIGIYKGRFLSVECKATGKKIKADSAQEKFLKMVRNQGGIAFECDDPKKIEKLLYKYK